MTRCKNELITIRGEYNLDSELKSKVAHGNFEFNYPEPSSGDSAPSWDPNHVVAWSGGFWQYQ